MMTCHAASDQSVRPRAAGRAVLTIALLLCGCHSMPPAAVVDARASRVPPADHGTSVTDRMAAARDSSESVRTVAFESAEPAASPPVSAATPADRGAFSHHAQRDRRTADCTLPRTSTSGPIRARLAGFRLSTPVAAWSADRWLRSATHVRLRSCRLVTQ